MERKFASIMKLYYLYIWREHLQMYIPDTAIACVRDDGECFRLPIRRTLADCRFRQMFLPEDVPSFTIPIDSLSELARANDQ